jgi:hypothetical protein
LRCSLPDQVVIWLAVFVQTTGLAMLVALGGGRGHLYRSASCCDVPRKVVRSSDAVARALSTLWRLPIDVLRRDLNVAGLAVDAAVKVSVSITHTAAHVVRSHV